MFKILFLLIALFSISPTKLLAAEGDNIHQQACKYVANAPDFVGQLSNKRLENVMQRGGWVDVNNDGVSELVVFEQGGTSHSSNHIITLIDGSEAPEITVADVEEYEDYRWRGWASDLKWVKYKNNTYLLTFYDPGGEYPEVLWFIDKDNKVHKICDYESIQHTKHGHVSWPAQKKKIAWAKGFCMLSTDDSKLSFIESQSISQIYFDVKTNSNNKFELDYNNDGVEDVVYEIAYSSGAGAGCGSISFGAQDGEKVEEWYDWKPRLRPVLKWKNTEVRCRLPETRFVKYKDYTIILTGSSNTQLTSINSKRHESEIVFGDETVHLCHYSEEVKINYTINPKLTRIGAQ